MTDPFRIRHALPGEERSPLVDALSDVLIDCLEGGASIGFMLPLARDRARAFWENALSSASRGERVVLLAEDTESGALLGTVQAVWATPDNQPHRADVAKMQVHRRARRTGVGAALLRAVEEACREAGKTLLVLDTVTGGDAERLYTRLGWQPCGVIPGYALWPQGGLCSTTVFYRELAPRAEGVRTRPGVVEGALRE
jgi:GNAT superfamily N-acetyltransferase